LQQTLRLRSKIFSLSEPKVMGIINVTPDSFFAESRAIEVDAALHTAKKMVEQGADILDVGAQSTRPGAEILNAEQEWQRLKEPLQAIRSHFPETPISVDTFHAEVAQRAIEIGADMINDVRGGQMDDAMFSVVGEYRVPYVLMHSRGDSKNMQNLTHYDDIFSALVEFFHQQVYRLQSFGAVDIVLDPGIGFAKTHEQGFEILRRLPEIQELFDQPILIGVSRKSLLYKTLGVSPEDVLPATDALHMAVISNGARILRVHDVLAAKQVIHVYSMLAR
jgi:dihydropteroate synthase